MPRRTLLTSFPRVFWVANGMELFERAAYYGLNSVLAVYLTASPATGGLGFGEQAVGFLQGIVYAATYVIPILGGALADRYGYRRMLLFAFSRSFVLSLFILPVLGFSSISMLASTNTLLQTLSPDHLRGRVLGFYTTAFLGTMPIGSFLLGVVASQIGAPLALVITAGAGELSRAISDPIANANGTTNPT